MPGCAGGQYGPPSPRRAEPPPSYPTSAFNRSDHPEDRGLGERCLSARLPDFGGAAGVLPAGGAVARHGVDLLRHRAGTGLAAHHSRDRPAASAVRRPPVVGRLARPLGRRHPGRRRHQLQPEDGLPGLPREPAPRRALDAARCPHARLPGHDERSDHVDAAVDRGARAEPAEQRGEPGLQGAALPRGQLRAAGGCWRARASRSGAFAAGEGPDPATLCTAGCGSAFDGENRDPLR